MMQLLLLLVIVPCVKVFPAGLALPTKIKVRLLLIAPELGTCCESGGGLVRGEAVG
jgi:hypothetical protein